MGLDTVIKVTLVSLFLLFAYFMIGGYTPCIDKSCAYPLNTVFIDEHMYPHHTVINYNNNDNFQTNELNKIPSFNSSVDMYPNKNIYQMGPYLNV